MRSEPNQVVTEGAHELGRNLRKTLRRTEHAPRDEEQSERRGNHNPAREGPQLGVGDVEEHYEETAYHAES